MTFQLDSRLESDTDFIFDLDLCQMRLNHNAAFPWIVLIPKQPELIEIIDLDTQNQQLLMREISLTSKIMQQLFHPIKLNIANLGNIVPQLHIHIIARYKDDKAWPGPVWNAGISENYEAKAKAERIEQIRTAFRVVAQSTKD
ncbi:MAG: HIT family protein [Alphaproteobacteria bacterium]|nr:HIT family protein [Alphaproteobacteria bacterium]